MQAKQLSSLLQLIHRVDERLLVEIAACPASLTRDFDDRAIVAVAAGELEWRKQCQISQ